MAQSRPAESPPLSSAFGDVDSDAELLKAFAAASPGSSTSQAVLAQIVERHGTLVYQVAQRMVSDSTLVDDVFQATFLVLAQSARKIQKSASLSSWLHGTARNIGRRALSDKFGVRSQTKAGVEMRAAVEDDPFSEMIRSHERQLLDEELQQLPESYRAPLVLHYFEQRSNQDISLWLGITVAAVESRLKRAKQLLRVRLVRRGITLSVAVAAWSVSSSVASATPPVALISSTISLASSSTAVATSVTAITASTAIQLAGKELAAMSAASKATVLFLSAAGTLTVGGAVLFGTVYGGLSRGGQGPLPVSIDPTAIIAVDAGLSDFAGELPPTFLAQAEPVIGQASPDAVSAEKNPLTTDVIPDQATPATTEVQAQPAKDPNKVKGSKTAETEFKSGLSEYTSDVLVTSLSSLSNNAVTSNPEARAPIVAGVRNLGEADRKIYEALDQDATLEFRDLPLTEVVEYLQSQHRLKVRLDLKTLEDTGVSPTSSINFQLDGLPLSTGLALMLENIGDVSLEYYIDRGMLIITTQEQAMSQRSLRFYDLASSVDNLAQAVETYANKFEAAEYGALQLTPLGDCLAIETSFATHQKIEEFIIGVTQVAKAREAAGIEFHLPGNRPTSRNPAARPSPATAPQPTPAPAPAAAPAAPQGDAIAPPASGGVSGGGTGSGFY